MMHSEKAFGNTRNEYRIIDLFRRSAMYRFAYINTIRHLYIPRLVTLNVADSSTSKA